jgi:hypothetical protein
MVQFEILNVLGADDSVQEYEECANRREDEIDKLLQLYSESLEQYRVGDLDSAYGGFKRLMASKYLKENLEQV